MSDFNKPSNASGNCRDADCSDVIHGIDCHVTGCKYHHPGGQCSATNVKIEAPDAHTETDTYCGSFEEQTSYATSSVNSAASSASAASVNTASNSAASVPPSIAGFDAVSVASFSAADSPLLNNPSSSYSGI